MNPPSRHLANAKAAIEDAHVGMHPHVEDGINSVLSKDVIYFCSPIGDHIAACNGKQGCLPAPCTVLGVSRSIASAIAVVDR